MMWRRGSLVCFLFVLPFHCILMYVCIAGRTGLIVGVTLTSIAVLSLGLWCLVLSCAQGQNTSA